ncbi:hypothetical protein ABUW04_19360 [Streptacidiphilus sp. N1-10]|uniref:Molybdopterin-dependent oxidoreductase n=1 Tax=Streptacidiphilus jeojiensis TaxID=3229225 RepID=A0ABV6XQH2_9ACTN
MEHSSRTQRTAVLELTGAFARPSLIDVAELARRPLHQAEVTFACATSGIQRHRFQGPLLHDVVLAAAPGFELRRRKDRAGFLLSVTGADGHHAVLSWGEIDPDFAHQPVLLATRADGQPLDACGPQLVVPQDRCGGRYVSGVTRIHLTALDLTALGLADPALAAPALTAQPVAEGHSSGVQ